MKTAIDPIKTDPREYFRYPACARCRDVPCNSFRFNKIYGSRLKFAHQTSYNTKDPCPFAAKDFHEVEFLLGNSSIQELHRHIQMLIMQMTVAETLHQGPDRLLGYGGSWANAIGCLRQWWEDGIFSLLRAPALMDEKMRAWFKAWDDRSWAQDGPAAEKEEQQSEAPEAAAQTSAVTFSDTNWEHADDARKKDSPDTVQSGDSVKLFAVVKGLSGGEQAGFEIWYYNDSANEKFDSAAGSVSGTNLTAQWKADFSKIPEKEFKLRFRPTAGKDVGDFCEIGQGEELIIDLHIDPDDPNVKNDKFILYGIDDSFKSAKTVQDDTVAGDAMLSLSFPGLSKGKKFKLVREHEGEEFVIDGEIMP